MIALPAAFAVTSPPVLTVATEALLVVQLTFLFVAFAGWIVAVSCCVAPIAMLTVDGETVTPVTATFVVMTVIAQVAVLLPSCVVTVMLHVPTATAVIRPELLTVATD